VRACNGITKFGLRKIGRIAINNIPPPKPTTPAITEVHNEINPNTSSVLNYFPYVKN
jgi:hypothetical protein